MSSTSRGPTATYIASIRGLGGAEGLATASDLNKVFAATVGFAAAWDSPGFLVDAFGPGGLAKEVHQNGHEPSNRRGSQGPTR